MRSNRYDRRIARRQIGELAEKAKVVRSELFSTVATLAENEAYASASPSDEIRASNESLRRDVRKGIESYVDALGQLVSVDDRDASPAFKDDEPFYELLASMHWCGATSAEQAKEVLLEEVAVRSVGKSDLGVLLSSIDHTAYRLYGTMPEPFKDVHGEALVEGIIEHLLSEEFDKTLTSDTRWAAMRVRWVRLGWRGSNAETFNKAFIRAAAERAAEIHDAQGEDAVDGGFAIVDTILDERMQRARPEMRKRMMEAFAARLVREWELILLQRAHRVGSDPDTNGHCPFCGKAVSVSWGDPPIDPGALFHAMPTCPQYDTMTADEFVRAVADKNKQRELEGVISDGKSAIEFTFPSDDVKRLDVVADRWNTTREGALNRIIHEAVDEKRVLALDSVGITTAIGMAKGGAVVVSPKSNDAGFIDDGPWWDNNLPYSDHELMRRGRFLWEATYATGLTDEQIRKDVVQSDAGFHAELVHFSAKWAVHAFQRLMTSHTFAAALMCSDVQRDVLVGIEKQWDAFLVIVPNGMLLADRFEFTRVAIATYDFGARMMLITADPFSKERRSPTGLTDEAPTLADLLVSEEENLHAESEAARCFVLAKRLVAGLLLNLQHEPNFQIKKVEARPKSKKREAEPEHRIVTVGKPIEIDCRASVKEYIEHGKTGRKHGPPTVQVMVRGHYRRQVCGVGRMERKVIWIEPFWRGPEAALIQTRAKVTTHE